MSTLQYPPLNTYVLPRKNVLVVSCIDLRLTDNMVDFLHFDNLTNRYDHFILAGTSLTAFACGKHAHLFKPQAECKPKTDTNETAVAEKMEKELTHKFESWKRTLDDHIDIAVALHDIRDVYLIEHEDCGAYKEFLIHGKGVTGIEERQLHWFFAKDLSAEIHGKEYQEKIVEKHADGLQTVKDKAYHLNVHTFFIDLRGNVELLHSTTYP